MGLAEINNIFNTIPSSLINEEFQTLLHNKNVRIERIVSKGHTTPEGDWYDQDWDEWVILLQGQAVLYCQIDSTIIALQAGDYLFIPAHCKHRVDWTSTEVECIWLAIHMA